MAWSRLARKYDALRGLEPALVRLKLDGFGTYDALRAGRFESVDSALGTCAPLLADNRDCFVVPD